VRDEARVVGQLGKQPPFYEKIQTWWKRPLSCEWAAGCNHRWSRILSASWKPVNVESHGTDLRDCLNTPFVFRIRPAAGEEGGGGVLGAGCEQLQPSGSGRLGLFSSAASTSEAFQASQTLTPSLPLPAVGLLTSGLSLPSFASDRCPTSSTVKTGNCKDSRALLEASVIWAH